MLKKLFFLVLAVVFSANLASAQPGNPCDPAVVAQYQTELIADGFECLVGAGPFECVNEVIEYAFENCPPPFDSTYCNPVFVTAYQDDLISQGFECLVGAGPFTCPEEVIIFAFENCPPQGDTSTYDGCTPEAVAAVTADLLAQGYTCVDGAGPFTCSDDVIFYALENCPLPYDTTGIPACILNVPDSIITFQEFINYLAECDPVLAADIPACWLAAPTFATDEEFIEWITINCGFDSLMNNQNEITRSYFGTQSVSSTTDVKAAFDVQISPNPASTAINVRLKEGEISRIELFDINGRTVLVQNNVANAQANVNLSGVAAGMYMVRVYDANNGVVTSRIVKQ